MANLIKKQVIDSIRSARECGSCESREMHRDTVFAYEHGFTKRETKNMLCYDRFKQFVRVGDDEYYVKSSAQNNSQNRCYKLVKRLEDGKTFNVNMNNGIAYSTSLCYQYYAVIYKSSNNGETTHVNVYRDEQIAKVEAEENGGFFVAGIKNIISSCTWWMDTDTMSYRRRWVLDNAI